MSSSTISRTSSTAPCTSTPHKTRGDHAEKADIHCTKSRPKGRLFVQVRLSLRAFLLPYAQNSRNFVLRYAKNSHPAAFVGQVIPFDRVRRRLQKLVYITQIGTGCADIKTSASRRQLRDADVSARAQRVRLFFWYSSHSPLSSRFLSYVISRRQCGMMQPPRPPVAMTAAGSPSSSSMRSIIPSSMAAVP